MHIILPQAYTCKQAFDLDWDQFDHLQAPTSCGRQDTPPTDRSPAVLVP
jgi:hypothetical protein